MEHQTQSGETLKKGGQASLTWNTSTSFLLAKKSFGGFHLVTAFAEVRWYSKLQPLLLPDVDSTLHTISPWKYIIQSDLICSHPISLHQSVHKISHGIAWLRDCIRNIVSHPGRLHPEGMYTKLADDLYCQGDSSEEHLSNWSHLLEAPSDCSLCLSATNQHLSCMGFCPKVYSQLVPIVLLHSLAAFLLILSRI